MIHGVEEDEDGSAEEEEDGLQEEEEDGWEDVDDDGLHQGGDVAADVDVGLHHLIYYCTVL